jgi:hypothetical protein
MTETLIIAGARTPFAVWKKGTRGDGTKGGKLADSALSVLAHLGTASPRWAGSVRPVLLTYLARTDPDRLPAVVGAIAPAFLPNAERELMAALGRRLAGIDPAVAEKAHDALRKAARKKKKKA